MKIGFRLQACQRYWGLPEVGGGCDKCKGEGIGC